ncbi:MAG TPA: TetR/AcrR family transcriptional regulator [Gemmatimonadales bacterium]|nr:TetR/AcrR family transcriptional regulator [Gemmatimonadales bacterium]
MGKGERTHTAILDHATGLASQVGLTGLTIGALADALDLSKSGLFAHFHSKEALQIEVLNHAAQRFTETVIRPALAKPRGAPRMQALFDGWIAWVRDEALPGGCVFVAANTELDDRPGPVRDRLVVLQQAWVNVMATSVRKGVESEAFRADTDPKQFTQEMVGILLSLHFHSRLLNDPRAEARARRAFKALLEGAKP